jgi:hypothetical protein
VPSSYTVKRTIAASPERIWALLVDAESYASWNPAVISLQGRIAEGETIKLLAAVNPKRTFSLKVSGIRPQHEMVWAEGMPLGLFRGVRTISLRALGEAETEFTMQEIYSGPLAKLITKAIPDLNESFAQFADGLKRAAEMSEG